MKAHQKSGPFAARQPDLMLSAMTIADLAKKMHCGKCGNRDVAYKAWRQEDAPGFAKRY
jgi:hypothetical protein